MTTPIYPLPGAIVIAKQDNVSGTFQLCRKSKVGVMTINCTEGCATVDMGTDIIDQILAQIEQPEPEKAA